VTPDRRVSRKTTVCEAGDVTRGEPFDRSAATTRKRKRMTLSRGACSSSLVHGRIRRHVGEPERPPQAVGHQGQRPAKRASRRCVSRGARAPGATAGRRRHCSVACKARAQRRRPIEVPGLPMTDEGHSSASRVVFSRDAAVCRPVGTLAIEWVIASRAHTSAVGLNAPAAPRADPCARVAAVHARGGAGHARRRCPRRGNLGAVAVISLL